MYTLWRDIGERKQTEAALKKAERKYRTIYENSIEGIFQTSHGGTILSANPALARMLGYDSPEETVSSATNIGTQFYVDPEERGRFLVRYQEHDCYQGFETEFKKKDGSKIWVYINARAVKDADGRVLYYEGTLQDITERKKAEAELHRERETFFSVLQNAPYGIFWHDPKGRCLFVNPEATTITGYTIEDIPTGTAWLTTAYPDPDYRKRIVDTWKRGVLEKSADRTFSVHCKDGTVKEIEFRSFGLPDGKAVTMFQDVTRRRRGEDELRKSREELRTLATHIQSVREEERTRIAREIHDELGQALTCVKLDLSEIEEAYVSASLIDGKVLSKTRSLLELVDGTIDVVRRIAADLRPSILDDLGLSAAVQWFLEDFQRRTGIQCELKAQEDMVIDKNIATAAFRIIQESLTNVARHSGADQAIITLKKRRGAITLTIEDSGRGILESEIASPRSFGIMGIKERVALLGGITAIVGKPGKGTAVTVRIPLMGKGDRIRKEQWREA